MMWFCGGHGACLTGAGPRATSSRRVIAWLKRYVAGDARSTPGPASSGWPTTPSGARADAPRRRARRSSASGSARSRSPPPTPVSGTPIAAGPAANAVNVPIPPPVPRQVVGEPRLRLTYSGTGTATHVFAQIVDEPRNLVLGNQVTPIPVTLDGARHTVTRPLEGVAAGAAGRATTCS